MVRLLGRVLRLLLSVAMAGAALVLLPSGLGAPAAAAPSSAYRDIHADEARTIPAYLEATDPDRVLRVFSVTFWARKGERRYVTSQVVARQPSSTPDGLLMASVSVTCSPDNGGVVNAGATQNLMRGTASVFTPRFVYAVPQTGMVSCVLAAGGLRPRPVSSGWASGNVWFVDSGSFLSVSGPMGPWTRSIESSARSRVLDAGERWTPITTIAWVRAKRAFEVTSDHKVTTCSAVSGSRDSSTLGRALCRDRVSTKGSRVRLIVSAVQLDDKGDPCADRQVFSELRRVSADVHHAMVFSKALVRVRGTASCSPRFAIRGSLVHTGGSDLVVHAPSERTAILRH